MTTRKSANLQSIRMSYILFQIFRNTFVKIHTKNNMYDIKKVVFFYKNSY